ncbi:MAG: hypothetical protein K2G44_05735 [Clostridia bacterium]|nr:hypothetical protein [Clostridia bacterium]
MKHKKIAASLELGAVYTWKFLLLLCVTFILTFSTASVMIYFSITEEIELLICVIMFYIMAILLLIVIIVCQRQAKKVKKWLADAVELTAQSTTLGDSFVWAAFFPMKTKKIFVKFEYEGRVIRKESGKNKENSFFQQGYSAAFRKYADREIKILYSPKYDQVLIMKD